MVSFEARTCSPKPRCGFLAAEALPGYVGLMLPGEENDVVLVFLVQTSATVFCKCAAQVQRKTNKASNITTYNFSLSMILPSLAPPTSREGKGFASDSLSAALFIQKSQPDGPRCPSWGSSQAGYVFALFAFPVASSQLLRHWGMDFLLVWTSSKKQRRHLTEKIETFALRGSATRREISAKGTSAEWIMNVKSVMKWSNGTDFQTCSSLAN